MEYRKFSKYYQYSLKDKVLAIPCGLDEDHPGMVPNLKTDDEGNDTIFLYCLACNYKLYPGLELYNQISLFIDRVN